MQYKHLIMKEKLYKNGKQTWFYTNCKRQRKAGAMICQVCPFRRDIEKFELSQLKTNNNENRPY